MNRVAQSFGRVSAIARKELRHLRRDRLTGGMVLGMPLMMTLLFGYAINQDVRHLRAGVADFAGTQRSRTFVADAVATQVVDAVEWVESAEALESLLRSGRISVGILIPRDFERRVAWGDRPAAQLLVDGGDPIVLGAARGLAALPIPSRYQPEVVRPASFEVRAHYNPERRSAVHIVPGLLGVILALTMSLFTSVAIVREKERGNLELLITTPVGTLELMIGKILPYVAIGYVQVSLILALGVFLFDVPIRGSLVHLYVGAGAYVGAMLTFGLLISTVANTQFQAFQVAFVSFVPQMLLSGFMFPFDGMPRPAQWLAQLFPLTHVLRVVRGVILRGAPLDAVAADIWPLGLFFVVAMSLSIARFRKRLD